MDSFKLGISLVVIVGGAVLGSGNVTSKENTKLPSHPKRLNEPKEDDSSSIKPGPGAGSVISGASLGTGVLTEILKALGDTKRKIAIGVENRMGHDWEALNVYFHAGTLGVPLPKEVSSGKAFLYGARKKNVVRGCVGVMAYYIPALNKTLSVMFSIPYDYNLYSNWWNVALTDGKSKASKARYNDMYRNDPFKGDGAWHERNIGSDLKVKGSMASSGTAILEIHVTD